MIQEIPGRYLQAVCCHTKRILYQLYTTTAKSLNIGLKMHKQLVWNGSSTQKYALKQKRHLVSMLLDIFSLFTNIYLLLLCNLKK